MGEQNFDTRKRGVHRHGAFTFSSSRASAFCHTSASRRTPLVLLVVVFSLVAPPLFGWLVALPRLGLVYRWLSCCLSSLCPVCLRLSFMTAFGVVCRRSCRHIRPKRRLLPKNRSGASPNIDVSFVVAARICRQRVYFACW